MSLRRFILLDKGAPNQSIRWLNFEKNALKLALHLIQNITATKIKPKL